MRTLIMMKIPVKALRIMRKACDIAHDICKKYGFRRAAIRCNDGWFWCADKIHDILMREVDRI